MWKTRACALAVTALALLTLSACVTAPSDQTAKAPATGAGTARPETIGAKPLIAKRAPTPWAQSLTYAAEGPFPVQLSSVPVGEFDANNKRDRG